MDWNTEAIKALYVEIGARVRRARRGSGWSQVQLAEAIDLTRPSIANLEAGRQHPPVHIMLLIAQKLGVTIDSLIPSGDDLTKIVTVESPILNLDGYSPATNEFVTAAVRRATGG